MARTGEQLSVLQGHRGGVSAVCAVSVDGRDLLASGGVDATVRVCDPSSRDCIATVPTHHTALGVTAMGGSLAVGLSSGILVIKSNAIG